MRGLVVLSSVAAAAGASATAGAEMLRHGALTLEWQAPAGCPGAGATLQRIRSLLARSPEARERVHARGMVEPGETGGSWRLGLETVQGQRRFYRTVQATSCEEATDAGALIIALAIDPELRVENSASSSPAPSAPRRLEDDADPVKPASTETRPGREVRPIPPTGRPSPPVESRSGASFDWRVTAGVLGDLGSLPRAAVGGAVALDAERSPFIVEIVGTLLPEARETIGAGRGGDVSLIAGGARACYAPRVLDLGARFCGGFEAGRLQGTGVGAIGWTGTRNQLWLAGRAGVLVRHPIWWPFAVRIGLEGLLPAQRPEFVLQNVGSVHQPARVVGRLELGLDVTL